MTASTNVRTSLFDSDLISVLRFTSLQQISNRYRRLLSAWPTSASYTKRNSDKVNIKHSPTTVVTVTATDIFSINHELTGYHEITVRVIKYWYKQGPFLAGQRTPQSAG